MAGARSMAPYAAAVADRLRGRNATYAAMSPRDVAEAAELLLLEISRVAAGSGSLRLDRHLRRIAALRADQRVSAADLRDAFSEVRIAFATALEQEPIGLAGAHAMFDAIDAAEAKMIGLLLEERSRRGE